MAKLLAARANFAVGVEDAIHRAYRAVIDALVEQGGVDFGRCQIDEAGRTEQVEHDFP
jgi:hypothetical protein